MGAMNDQALTPEKFVGMYGADAPVLVGRAPRLMQITLGQALAAEAAFCEGDDTKRQDPARRIRYMAQMLNAAGTLRPEHVYLLDTPDGEA